MDWKILTFIACISFSCVIVFAYLAGYDRGHQDGANKLVIEEQLGIEIQKRAIKAFDLIIDKIEKEAEAKDDDK